MASICHNGNYCHQGSGRSPTPVAFCNVERHGFKCRLHYQQSYEFPKPCQNNFKNTFLLPKFLSFNGLQLF